MHLFGHTFAIMITTSNSSAKRSGLLNQFLGVLLHTIACFRAARVRTELCDVLVIPTRRYSKKSILALFMPGGTTKLRYGIP